MSPRPAYRASMNPGLLLSCALLLLVSCKNGREPGNQPADQPGNGSTAQNGPDPVQTSGAPDPANSGGSGSSAQQGGQWYHAWFVGDAEVGRIPFFLHLPAPPQQGVAAIAHGEQRIEAEARWYGSEASVNFPLYRTRLFLRRGDAGKLEGHLMSRSPVVTGTVSLPLQAIPVAGVDDSKRFPEPAFCGASADTSAPAPALPLGAWTVTWPDRDNDEGELLIEERAPGVVAGTFKFRDGSVVTMIGNVFGSRICLSSFEGVNPVLGIIDIDPEGAGVSGQWIWGGSLAKRFAFTGEKQQPVHKATDGITFVPNKTKLSLFELGVPQYRGKPVIIEFGGSWCPPCIDAVPLLKDLYEQHHGEGLEIVTLLFELIDDEDALRKQARLFVDTYDIPWTVVPVRGEIKSYWDIIPHDPSAPEVNLPVAIFVNANGTIRDAHMGFPSPASGQAHQAMVERYQRVARELVSKK